MRLILVTGKRFVGKNYCIERWVAETGGVHLSPTDVCKREYARQMGVPLHELHSRKKEQHRASMTEWCMAELARDPHVFDRAVLNAAEACAGWVFLDIRLRSQHDFFTRYGAITVQIRASESVRCARGWIRSAIDDHPTETELDSILDIGFENHSDPVPSIIRLVEQHGMNTESVDIAIVGCGPAGIAAAAYLHSIGRSFRVFEAGKRIQDRDGHNKEDVISGEGGAGLVNDGKFSFYPAGTASYDLMYSEKAYAWLVENVFANRFEHPIPEFPSELDFSTQKVLDGKLKPYPVQYLDRTQREKLISETVDRFRESVWFETWAEPRAHEDRKSWVVDTPRGTIRARALILCTGRFGPLAFSADFPLVFRRIEIGVRLEMPMDAAVGAFESCVDPKYLLKTDDGVVRTFCYCRSGTVVRTRSALGWETCSGHSDEPTDRLNHGVNLRVPWAERDDLEEFRHESYTDVAYSVWIHENRSMLGRKLRLAVQKYVESVGLNPRVLRVHSPCIEGVGFYPRMLHDQTQQVPSLRPLFVAGDANGTYRGLVPAMLGGVEAAMDCNGTLNL